MSDPAVSFEFFPPGDEAMAQQLWQSVQRLAPLRPSFVSVTYGADGSTRTRTHEFVERVLEETDLRVAPHLTCVGASREEVLQIARTYWQLGVRHLVALRGDAPPANVSADGRYRPYPGGFAYASDLVRGLREAGDFEVSVAAYPEGHPESGGVDADLENLKRKVDAGASRAITQFFFDQRFIFALPRSLRGRRDRRQHRPGDPARSRASRNCCASRRVAAPRFPTGCATGSTASTRIPIPAA